MAERPITPRTTEQRLLLDIRDELRKLNQRYEQQPEPNLTEPKRRTRKKTDDSDLSG